MNSLKIIFKRANTLVKMHRQGIEVLNPSAYVLGKPADTHHSAVDYKDHYAKRKMI